MNAYNKQASDFIFRENNAPSRVADDTIDLHGQFVEEAEDILEQRIRYAQQHGQTHLHVYVTPPCRFSISRLSISLQDFVMTYPSLIGDIYIYIEREREYYC
jgi:hypothetical protein